MPVENEVSVRTLLVLTDTGFNQRRSVHCRKTVLHVRAGLGKPFIADTSFTVSGIEFRATLVAGNFESLPLVPWNSLKCVRTKINPCGKFVVGESSVAGRRAEVKDLLSGGSY